MKKSFKEYLKQVIEQNVSQDIQSVPSVVGYTHDDDLYDDMDQDEEVLSELFQIYTEVYRASDSELKDYLEILVDEYEENVEDLEEIEDDDSRQYLIDQIIYCSLLLIEEGYDQVDILELLEIEESEIDLTDEEIDDIFDDLIDMFNSFYEDDDINERLKGRFTAKNYNRKKRKFMSKSKARLNRERTKRKQDTRKSRSKRRQYYRKNKAKLKRYRAQYAKAVKSGRHKKKIRRAQG